VIRESCQSWGSPSPSSISYVMASWSPSQSWTTDATCSRTTDRDAGACRSRLPALAESLGTMSACEWASAGETTTTDLWWTLFSGSTSTGGRWSAFQYETPDRLPTATSRSFAGKAYRTFVEFLQSFREGDAGE
jgi:hypothetical protein